MTKRFDFTRSGGFFKTFPQLLELSSPFPVIFEEPVS